jgi:alpha/beta superfamily hydrolase
MKIPAKTEPFLWGAAAGAIALAIVGFSWGGWVTGSTAQQLAGARAEQAMIASLTPICVAQFQKSPKVQASLAALKEIDSWQRGEYVSKGGWATMPGSKAEPNSEVAAACAAALTKLAL